MIFAGILKIYIKPLILISSSFEDWEISYTNVSGTNKVLVSIKYDLFSELLNETDLTLLLLLPCEDLDLPVLFLTLLF